jgi:hypothetical protein
MRQTYRIIGWAALVAGLSYLVQPFVVALVPAVFGTSETVTDPAVLSPGSPLSSASVARHAAAEEALLLAAAALRDVREALQAPAGDVRQTSTSPRSTPSTRRTAPGRPSSDGTTFVEPGLPQLLNDTG